MRARCALSRTGSSLIAASAQSTASVRVAMSGMVSRELLEGAESDLAEPLAFGDDPVVAPLGEKLPRQPSRREPVDGRRLVAPIELPIARSRSWVSTETPGANATTSDPTRRARSIPLARYIVVRNAPWARCRELRGHKAPAKGAPRDGPLFEGDVGHDLRGHLGHGQ